MRERGFFIHVMKTAGTTVKVRTIDHNLATDDIYPHPERDPLSYDLTESPYWRVDRLRELDAERHRSIRCYTGHFPWVASTLVGGPVRTFTLLRDPVERVVSHLRHCKTYHPHHADLTAEEIYADDPWRERFMINFQTKIFAFTTEDEPSYCHDLLTIDADRLAIAKDHLGATDLVGLQDDVPRFLEEVAETFDWRVGAHGDRRVSEPFPVGDALRAQIARDNAIDIEFFEFARELVARRRS